MACYISYRTPWEYKSNAASGFCNPMPTMEVWARTPCHYKSNASICIFEQMPTMDVSSIVTMFVPLMCAQDIDYVLFNRNGISHFGLPVKLDKRNNRAELYCGKKDPFLCRKLGMGIMLEVMFLMIVNFTLYEKSYCRQFLTVYKLKCVLLCPRSR